MLLFSAATTGNDAKGKDGIRAEEDTKVRGSGLNKHPMEIWLIEREKAGEVERREGLEGRWVVKIRR